MFINDKTDSDSNFWISYADLMAGLLFVFILLIGAIVSKSTIVKAQLHVQEDKLSNLSQTLESKENTLETLNDSLAQSKALVEEKDDTLLEKKKLLAEKEKQLLVKNAQFQKDKIQLDDNEKSLKLKLSEIKKLKEQLFYAKEREYQLNSKIVNVQDLLNKNKDILNHSQDELKQNKKSLKDYEDKVLILSTELNDSKVTVKIKDQKLLTLLNAMDEKKTKYDDLVANLQSQKAKIKSLTGVKLQVVTALKKALGDKINIDRKTGSLRLASNILFEKRKATLKNESKIELKKAFEDYIGTLITDKEIKPHIDKIIIEGHTDSDGEYMYNLALSQKRALAVMEYLLTLKFSKEHNIKPLMIASGRAYLDAITKDGIEDKDASRRIEIKFRLKNEDAMLEIEKVLDAQ